MDYAAYPSGLDSLLTFLLIELESLEKSDYKESGRDSGAQHVATHPACSRYWKQPMSIDLQFSVLRDVCVLFI